MYTSYLIHTSNLFDTNILIKYIKQNSSSNPNTFIIHGKLFIEVQTGHMKYTQLFKLCEQYATKVVRKIKSKNSTKYITMLHKKAN